MPFFKADPKPVMYGRVPLFVPEPKAVMYGPVLPDPSAPECGIDDQACIERHDARVLGLASSSHARQECAESTHPDSCYDAYDMMAGDFVPRPDPILNDPCAWVVLVDHNVATVTSKKLGITKRVLNKGWKARTFIGACNVSSVVPMQPAAVIPMPAWTVRKGQALQTTATPAPAPRVVTMVPVPIAATPGPTTAAASLPTAPTASTAAAPVTAATSTPATPAPSRPTPVAPPAVQPPVVAPAPPAPVAGPPGGTQPPPFARPATISDSRGGAASSSR